MAGPFACLASAGFCASLSLGRRFFFWSPRVQSAAMTEEKRVRPFRERFDIDVGVDEVKRRFVHRASNLVFDYVSQEMRTQIVGRRTIGYPIGFRETVKTT
jgi:hypothetical protein